MNDIGPAGGRRMKVTPFPWLEDDEQVLGYSMTYYSMHNIIA